MKTRLLSLLLALAMLFGATAALTSCDLGELFPFGEEEKDTDDEKDKNDGGENIDAKDLEMSLYWADASSESVKIKWKDAASGNIFTEDLWEPGRCEAKYIKVVNDGTLAVNYALTVAADGEASELADVIEVYCVSGTEPLNRADLTSLTPFGTLTDVIESRIPVAAGELDADSETAMTLIFKMREDASNKYSDIEIGAEFAVKLTAVKASDEDDGQSDVDKLLALLTAKSLKGALDDLGDAYAETPMPDLTEAIEGVNIHADYQGNTVSVKDGYLVSVDRSAETPLTSVIGLKDGYAIFVEDDVVTDQELLIPELPASEVYGMLEELKDLVDVIDTTEELPDVTSSDVQLVDGWYCLTDDYIKRALTAIFMLSIRSEVDEKVELAPPAGVLITPTPSVELTSNETDAQMAETERMIGQIIDELDITVGLAFNGEQIYGVTVEFDAPDLSAIGDIVGQDLRGHITMKAEAKLTSDLSALDHITVRASIDMQSSDVTVEERLDAQIEYVGQTLTVNAEMQGNTPELEGLAAEVRLSVSHDDDYVPTVIEASCRFELDNVKKRSVSGWGYYEAKDEDGNTVASYPYYAWCERDIEYGLDAMIDLTRLESSGRAIDIKISVREEDPQVYADPIIEYVYDEASGESTVVELMSAGEVLATLSDADMADLVDLSYDNFDLEIELVTDGGAGTLVITDTYTISGEINTLSIFVEVNSENAVSASEAAKKAIEEYVIVDESIEQPLPDSGGDATDGPAEAPAEDPEVSMPNDDVQEGGSSDGVQDEDGAIIESDVYVRLAYTVLPMLAEELGLTVGYCDEENLDDLGANGLTAAAAISGEDDISAMVLQFGSTEEAKLFADELASAGTPSDQTIELIENVVVCGTSDLVSKVVSSLN